MQQRLEELQARLDGVARELSEVQARLAQLEARSGGGPLPPRELSNGPLPAAEAAIRPRRDDAALAPTASSFVALVGRTLVVLGGGYLLRALTDAGLLPERAGAALGLLYAAWWLWQADRADRKPDATFHGLASAMIAYPLIAEAATRFGLLAGTAAASVLVSFFGLGLWVACRRASAALAWIAMSAAVLTGLMLLVATRDLAPFTAALLLVAAVAEALAVRDRWLGLRWPAALGADLAVLVTLFVFLRPGGLPEGYRPISAAVVIAAAIALPLIGLAAVAVRTLRGERPVTVFECLQSPTALILGLGGAARVLESTSMSPAPLGLLALGLGAAWYATGFAWLERRAGQRWSFYFQTTLAGVLVLTGSRWVLPGPILTAFWLLLAIAAVWLGRRFERATLSLHGAVYLALAAATAGLLASAGDGLLAGASSPLRAATALGLATILVAALCYGLLAVGAAASELRRHRLARAATGLLLAWSVGGVAAGFLGAAVVRGAEAGDAAALLAADRMGILALLAMALAWASRRFGLEELAWLVYPALAVSGLELLLVFRDGRPFTLFLSLALYGVALIATPRLMRTQA